MSNALHEYAKLFEKYAANNNGTGAILAGEDCLSLANEMRIDADAIDAENKHLRELNKFNYECSEFYRDERDKFKAENDKLRELVKDMWPHVRHRSRMCSECDLPCYASDECLLYEPMRQRMHELRMEVEE